MGFKDVVRSDIDRVFLNLQEFADEHIVQGDITTPVENEEISVDDWTFTVKKVSREMGMLVIEARRYDQ